jgi:hypothetical protein
MRKSLPLVLSATLIASFAVTIGACHRERDPAYGAAGDPMGAPYDGTDGTVGWRVTFEGGDPTYGLGDGAQKMGCNAQRSPGRLAATCRSPMDPGRFVTLYAYIAGRVLYRICAAGTSRPECRATWDRVHEAMRSAGPVNTYGGPAPTGYAPAPTGTPAPTATGTPTSTATVITIPTTMPPMPTGWPTAVPTGTAPPAGSGGWF